MEIFPRGLSSSSCTSRISSGLMPYLPAGNKYKKVTFINCIHRRSKSSQARVCTVTSPALATDTPLMFIRSLGRSSTTPLCSSGTMTSPDTCLSTRQRSATLRRAASALSTAMPTLCLVPSIPGLPSPTTYHTTTITFTTSNNGNSSAVAEFHKFLKSQASLTSAVPALWGWYWWERLLRESYCRLYSKRLFLLTQQTLCSVTDWA